MLGAEIPVLLAFGLYQRRVMARGGSPLLELTLFKEPGFAAGLLVALVLQTAILSFFVTMVTLLQVGYGLSPIAAALVLMPFQLTAVGSSLASAGLSKRLRRSILQLGAGFLALGIVGIFITLNLVGTQLQGLVLGGLGFGFTTGLLQNIALARVNPAFAGSASGSLSTAQQLGSALGVAIAGVILFDTLASNANRVSQNLVPQLEASLQTIMPEPALQQVVKGFQSCFADRSSGSNPSYTPQSCRAAQSAPLGPSAKAALSGLANQARTQNFIDSTPVTLRYHFSVYVLCFLLVFALPLGRILKPRHRQMSP